MMRRSIWLAAILLLVARPAPACDQAAFDAAGQAYSRGDIKGAGVIYRSLADAGCRDADLFYNLGTVCLEAGEIGCAVLNLLRSVRLDPDCDECADNLELARSRQPDTVIRGEQGVVQAGGLAIDVLVGRIPSGPVAAAFASAWAALFLLLCIHRIGPLARRFRHGLFYATLLAGLMATGTGLLFLAGRNEAGSRVGVVTASETALREGPDPRFRQVTVIHAGLELAVVDDLSGWYRVRLANGETGFVESAAVGLTEPDR